MLLWNRKGILLMSIHGDVGIRLVLEHVISKILIKKNYTFIVLPLLIKIIILDVDKLVFKNLNKFSRK